MEKVTLLYCTHCKKIIEILPGSHCCPTICCGEPMVELKRNTTDAATEKHVPVITRNRNKVEVVVGSTIHPMSEVHHIDFIYLVTNKNVYRHDLKVTDEPKATFILDDDEVIEEAIEHCNLHGLWSKAL